MEKVISEINNRVKNVLDPQWHGVIQMLKVLSDGQPHQFTEIRDATGFTGATVSKHLKTLLKADALERHVNVSAFPPKSAYKLTGAQHSKFFVAIAKELYVLDKVADDILATASQANQPHGQQQALKKLEETLTWLRRQTVTWIWENALASSMLPEHAQHVYAAARAYSLLLLYFTLVEAVKIAPVIEECFAKIYPELAQGLAAVKEKCTV